MAVNESPTSGTAAVQPAMDASAGRAGRPDGASIGPMQLFTAFTRLSLSGFGGVLPFAYRALVENRKWLDAREFASLLAIAQVMPGPTICNLSVMIGQRYAGFAGSCAALAGMVLGPSCIVIALGIAWQHYGELSAVKRALGGMSAVAIGLIFATAVKMGINLFRSEPAVIASRPVPGAGVQPGGSDAVVPTSSSQDLASGSSLNSANGSPHAAAPAPSIASSPSFGRSVGRGVVRLVAGADRSGGCGALLELAATLAGRAVRARLRRRGSVALAAGRGGRGARTDRHRAVVGLRGLNGRSWTMPTARCGS